MFAVEAFATGGESNYIYIGCYIGNYYQQRSQIYGDMIGICGWSFGQAWCFLSKMSSESSGLLLFYHDQTCSLLKTRNIGKTNLNGVVL
jgi:hypothetical protein